MILTCASCATRYYADEASIPPHGRQVRCAACGHAWRVEKELVLEPGGPAPATFVDEPQLSREQIERARKSAGLSASPTQQARQRQIERQRLERFRAAAIAWGGAGAALAALLVIAVVFRQGVAKIWPNTASAYAAIGLSVNITGLEFSDLDIVRNLEAPAPTITVTGSVRNIGAKARAAPVLRFGLRDQNAEEVRHWLVALGGPPIAPGGARQFQSVLTAPPLSAVDLEATFATASEALTAPTNAAPSAADAEPSSKRKPAAHGGQARATIVPLRVISPTTATRDGFAPRAPTDPSPAG